MAYDVSARIHVACHRDVEPSDAEWTAYLAHIEANLARIEGVLVLAPGGNLSFGQQRTSADFWKRQAKTPPIAVVTASRSVVRAAGALRWFMPAQIRAFGTWDADAVFAHLGCDARMRRLALHTLGKLAERLDVALPTEWRSLGEP